MTHSGGKPHAVSDKGQRYEVRYLDGEGAEHVMGWTEAADGGGLANSLSKHPVWKLSRIVDRGERAATEFAWVIERGSSPINAPIYFAPRAPNGWSSDHLMAQRFKTQSDAEQIIAAQGLHGDRVREHGWG